MIYRKHTIDIFRSYLVRDDEGETIAECDTLEQAKAEVLERMPYTRRELYKIEQRLKFLNGED